MRKVQSVSVEDRLTKTQRTVWTGSAERLRDVIIENLKVTEAETVAERARSFEWEGGATYSLVVRVGSSGRVVAIAERIASACAAEGIRTPQVVRGATSDILSLDFGLVYLTIENANASLGDPLPTKDEVLREAQRVFADAEKASRWLQRQSRVLGGRTPLAMLDSEAGIREVAEELGRIDHGIYS